MADENERKVNLILSIQKSDDLSTFKNKELRSFLKYFELPSFGNKTELIERVSGAKRLKLDQLEVESKADANRNTNTQKNNANLREDERLKTPLGEVLPNPTVVKSGWQTDSDKFPQFSWNELYNYLVLNKQRTFDFDALKANKELKAKIFYKDGHIQNVMYNDIEPACSHCFVKCECLPSVPTKDVKKKPAYGLWVCLAKYSGRVHSAFCECVSGCAIPGLDNDTFVPSSEWHGNLINNTIPSSPTKASCWMYNVSKNVNTSDAELIKCDKWVYDTSVFTSTQVTEFDFVCDDEMKIAHGKTIFFAGKLFGALFFGMLGDRFGRRISLLSSLATTLVGSLVVPWTPSFSVFMFLRLLIGAGSTGLYINIFVLVVEFMGVKRRVLAAASIVINWVMGKFLVIAIAYFVRDWKTLQLVVHAPFALMFIYVWLIPESVRWLATHGRIKDAESALKRIAKFNNKEPLPDSFLETEVRREQKESLLNVFRSRKLLIRFFISIMNWMICCMVLYGLTYNAEKLDGDVFVNFSATILVEAPSYIIVIFLVDRTGRRRLYIIATLIGGVACVGTIFPVLYDKKGLAGLTLALSTIGKTAVTGAYFIVYIFTPELFPTTLRLSIMGVSSCTARIGVMAGIYIAELGTVIGGNIGVAFPLVVFGGFTVLAGVLSIFLPETKGLKLPETVADALGIQSGARMKRN